MGTGRISPSLFTAWRIDASQAVTISYGKGLAGVSIPALERFVEAMIEHKDGGAWSALEVLSMYTYGSVEHDPAVVLLAKGALLAPTIADGLPGNSAHADYVYDRMLKMVEKSGAIDDAFARGFALLVERSCRLVGSRSFRPAGALRAALAIVVRHSEEAWPVLSGFYAVATRPERERLAAVTCAVKPYAWNTVRTGAGPLFETPIDRMLEWADEDPEGRVAFLVGFFPVLEMDCEIMRWHPALQVLADRYGGTRHFRSVRNRIFPNSWGGSLVEHLTGFLKPLAAWAGDHALGDWAASMSEAVSEALKSDFYRT